MFKKFFSGKKDQRPALESVNQLQPGDIILFKYRESLPPELREKQFEVNKIGTYEYSSGTSKEVVLKDDSDNIYFMALEENDGEQHLCLGKKISRQQVYSLFNEETFAQLWTEQWVDLESQEQPQALNGWLARRYSQTIKDQKAYYYARDCHGTDLSQAEDGEELRFHECEGDDDHYGLNIEINDDGSTDVFLQVYCPADVIAEMWPHGD
ncbi:MAG: hypothetical protein JKX83_01820 [Pseudomonadales bacterium]|nr:hypothetical protein [Pseudomonadales bacterium]